MKNCQNCNAEMADNMNFCPSCRTKYESPIAVRSNVSTNTNNSNSRVHELAKILLNDPQSGQNGQLTVLSCDSKDVVIKARKTPLWMAIFMSHNDLAYVIATLKLDKSGSVVTKNYKYRPSVAAYICSVIYLIMFICLIKALGVVLGGIIGFLAVGFLVAIYLGLAWAEICCAKKYLEERLETFKQYFVPNQHGFLIPEKSTMNLRGKSPVEIAKSCFPIYGSTMLNHEKFYLAPNLDENYLNLAIANYAQNVDKKDVICMLVTSEKTSAIFTTKGIYATLYTGLIKRKGFLAYNDIVGTRDMFGKEVFVNNGGYNLFYRNTFAESLTNSLVSSREELLKFIRNMQDY